MTLNAYSNDYVGLFHTAFTLVTLNWVYPWLATLYFQVSNPSENVTYTRDYEFRIFSPLLTRKFLLDSACCSCLSAYHAVVSRSSVIFEKSSQD